MTTPALAEHVRGRGRHYRHPETGDLLPSVTNVIGILDKPALPRWAAREVAKAAWTMRDSLSAMGEDEAVDVLKGSPWRRSTRAADRGTTIHAWLEQRMLGATLPAVSGEATQYVDAAEAWVDYWKPEVIATEVTLFHGAYAGTTDAIVRMRDETWMIDFKTSSGLYPEVALQLAALAYCPRYVADGELLDTPKIDRLAAVRIGTGGEWEMREVIYRDQSADAFMAALDLWTWKYGDKPLSEEIR